MTGKQWESELARVLCELGLIGAGYSGKVVINLNQGGITEVEKIEKVTPETPLNQVGGDRLPD
jgi:hypothetical protein